jgi:hypothetical protein
MSNESAPPGHDPDYLSRRASQERLAAERSSDPSARRVHEALADEYAERLRARMPAAV